MVKNGKRKPHYKEGDALEVSMACVAQSEEKKIKRGKLFGMVWLVRSRRRRATAVAYSRWEASGNV